MKNDEALLQFRLELLEKGEIGATGQKILYNGEWIPEPEALKTRTDWKRFGREIRDEREGHPFKMWFKRKDGGFYTKWIRMYAESDTVDILA